VSWRFEFTNAQTREIANSYMKYIWLIPLLPGLGAAIDFALIERKKIGVLS